MLDFLLTETFFLFFGAVTFIVLYFMYNSEKD